ncbi:MAG TPA: universal stress protein [Solirubrobacteraceae bacterium]
MFRSVVVAVKDGPAARDAIALAADLVADGGELTLAYVYLGGPTPTSSANSTLEAAERERALELLAATREEAGVQAGLLTGGSQSVGRGLHELAERQHCDLLVVGSSTRAFFERAVMGSDTLAALDGAPCAVAVAPAGYAERPSRLMKIGVAYDGSPESEHALSVARELAAPHGARISAFEAVCIPAAALGPGGFAFGEAVNAMVQQARERIEALGGVEAHAAYGFVAEELARYSGTVDLLVVGSRGYGPLGRLVHGSTSNELARGARSALLVLTRAARHAHARAEGRAAYAAATAT